MKTTPKHRKETAAEIRSHIATSPARPPAGRWEPHHPHESDVSVTLAGKTRLRIRNHPDTLEAVARRIETGKALFRDPYTTTVPNTNILKFDAVMHCGSPEAAAATIRRQIAAQGADMHPADVRRCERAASLIEWQVEAEIREAREAACEEELEDRIAAGRQPDMQEVIAPGTEVCVTHNHRRYLGTVTACKVGPHPVLGKGHPVAVCTIRASHAKETRGKRYAFHPLTRPTTLNKAIWGAITIP